MADTLLGTTNMMENLMRYLVLAAGLACLSAAVGLLASETAWGGPCDPTHIPKTKICRPSSEGMRRPSASKRAPLHVAPVEHASCQPKPEPWFSLT